MPLQTTRTTILHGNDIEAKREEIRKYFHDTFTIHEQLYEGLADDQAFYRRADPLRHPIIFYLGHAAVFYVNKLVLAKLLPERINPTFESIFAVGVDEMSWDDLNEANYDWPPVSEVRAYRKRIRGVVDELIQRAPLTLPVAWEDPMWAVLMGIEHERIHLETSSVLIRQLPLESVRPHPLWTLCTEAAEAPPNALLNVPGGSVVVGKERDHPLFGWDNEYGRQESQVADFRASKLLVSNGEYREFVDDGGYRNEELWTEEGWAWKNYRQAVHPLFWRPQEQGEWQLRTLLEEVPMPWNWPVEVNYLEAKAFCNWKGRQTGRPIRLPTEAEWLHMRNLTGIPDQPYWPEAPGNVNLEHYRSACPVDRFPQGQFYDVIGNVWQWTETPIGGLPGFQVHPLYDDFSTPTFDNRHNLIKGGSWISTGNEATRDSRYAFRRHFYQHAGLRYVESETPVVLPTDLYETDALVSQYCEFHYGSEYFDVPNFPVALAEICLQLIDGRRHERALDLGCAVGRSTLELTRGFEHVTGLDFSARFIRVADDLFANGTIRYVLPDEGELVSYHEQSLAALGFGDLDGKVEFFQADACNLKPLYRDYDLVLAANLIDRLYSPRRFLGRIHERIRAGGLLVIASPYTWLTEHTERSEWIGGFKRDGENLTTLDGLTEILGAHFRPIGAPREVPFVIRETRRKFQHSISQLTVWERVA